MLAMWHRVMSRPIIGFQHCHEQFTINGLRRAMASATYSVVINDSIVEMAVSDDEILKDPSFMGVVRPPSDNIFTEFELWGSQCGVLVSRSITDPKKSEFVATCMASRDGEVAVEGQLRFEILSDGCAGNWWGPGFDDDMKSERELQSGLPYVFAKIALFGFSFVHCKNVKQFSITEKHGPSAKWCRRMKVPSVEYKTLLIPGFTYEGRIVNNDGTLGEVASEDRRMHIVRGHFATYTADRPLFGRAENVGKFWHPAHVRGNMKNGAVVKDYEVAPVGV